MPQCKYCNFPTAHIMQLNADDYFKESRRNSFSPDPILSRPLLYCPKYLDSKEHYLRVRIGDSEWSKVRTIVSSHPVLSAFSLTATHLLCAFNDMQLGNKNGYSRVV